MRARYFEFDHTIDNDLNTHLYRLDAFTCDLELTYLLATDRNWSLLLSGGCRHFEFDDASVLTAAVTTSSEMTGIVVGGEASCGLNRQSGWIRDCPHCHSVRPNRYGLLKCSTIGQRHGVHVGNANRSRIRTEFLELVDVALRVGAEAQYWDDVTYRENDGAGSTPFSESIGLVGFVTGLTIRR